MTFRRSFAPLERDLWDELIQCVALHSATLEEDVIHWQLEPTGRFSTKSLYQAILRTPGPIELNIPWEFKLPLKIKSFLWQLVRGRAPSGMEVPKRHDPSDGLCPLCSVPEDYNQIFFSDGAVPPECAPDPSILRLSASLAWEEAREPLHADIDTTKTCGVGPGMAFARAILPELQPPGTARVGLIPCAVGGTAIREWAHGEHLYEQMVRRARVATECGEIEAVL
ncbi:putative carbohydrate esterase [Hordeum vulgare]|nr:putative carbohydrate esterase [Hordeum vulgare]